MCYFGHPAALENAALRAVEAGLAITRTVAALGASVRVGIATGPVAVLADQPVGLSIHLAARLQQATQSGTVLAAESTRRLVSHAFELQRLPVRPALKGIAADEDCYVVRGVRRDIDAQGLERPSSQTPLVGRSAELQRLQHCWQQTRADECRLVLIHAEAGMGKSRLVREFRHELGRSGVRVLECRCRAEASASPFLTLAEALRRWLDIGEQEPASTSLRKLAAALPDASREAEPLGLLADLLSITAQTPQASKGAPGRQRQRLLGLLLDWFANFARDRTCCLVVEDWHWVDPSMREFVEQLTRRSAGPGLLVVITSRPEAAADARVLAPPAQLVQIALGGLPPKAARELVAELCKDSPLPSSVVRQLAARGDGVPLFLEEATRMALELGGQGAREGAHESAGALQAVPASLHDLLMARLDGLGPARTVAQVAAVLGREFALDMLAALLEASGTVQDSGTLRERVALLVRSGLVRAEGAGHFAFKHVLIRDVAYGSLWARVRRDLHAHVVTLLKGSWAELGAQRPELLALHQTEAGHHRDALAQWEQAASKAAARSAEFEAISHLRRALAVLAQTEAGHERDRTALRLQLLLASRLLATEGYGAEAVLQAYREAEALCDVIGDETARFKVEMGLEAYRFMRADFDPALAHGQRAAAIAESSGDIKQRLHAHWGLACTLFHQGRLRATMREMDAALSLYTPALHRLFGIQDPGVMCMAYSSWGLWELGRPDAALSRINHAAELAGAFEHKFSQAVALAYGVSVELLRGETEAALARVALCIAVCDDAGFPVWLAIARCMRGHLLCVQGEFDTGLAEMRAGYALWLATGAKVSQPLYVALQAEGLMLAGQHEEATACVDEGLAIIGRYGERHLEAELWRLRATGLLQRGARRDAEEAYKLAYAIALRQHRLGFALRSATALARLWAEDGQHARARRLLLPLTARWTEGLHTRDVRTARLLCDTLD
jgi:tetratricopeptide (TPR) repeat protein